MRAALDEICPEGACARRSLAQALSGSPARSPARSSQSSLQPKIDDYIARSARVVRAIIAEKGGNGTDFLNWAKDRSKFLVTNNQPYSPPTYEDYLVHRELYS